MATVYGENADKILVDDPSQRADVGSLGGRVRCLYDKYTFTADLSSGDVIVMGGKIPKGARVIDAMVKHADLDTSGGTIDFGWAASEVSGEAADENGFLQAADVATGADVVKASDNQAGAAAIGKKFTQAVQPQIKIEGDTDVTSGDVESFIWYILD